MLASEVVTDKALKTTKVFRVEILKPVNYDWKEFYSIINKATYNAAKLANEVMINSFLLSKKYINRDGKSFCSLIISCKECGLGGRVKCAVCREAQLKYSSLAKKILRGDITLPTFRNNSLYIRKEGIHLERNSGGEYSVKLDILPGRDQKQPEVLLRTKEIEIKSPGYLQVLTRILDGGYRLGFTQLIRDKNRKKLYLMMSYTFDNDVNDGWEPGRVMGVDLGVATPAYCAFNDSFERKSFYVEGAKLLSIKREISARRRIIQRGITRRDLRRGHGLQSKFNPLEKRNTKWDNFRRTWNNIL